MIFIVIIILSVNNEWNLYLVCIRYRLLFLIQYIMYSNYQKYIQWETINTILKYKLNVEALTKLLDPISCIISLIHVIGMIYVIIIVDLK